MKKMKLLTAFLSAVTAVSLATATFTACAEEDPTSAEAVTEVVTEASTEETTEAETEAPTEEPTDAELVIDAYRDLFLEIFGDASNEKFEELFGVPAAEITDEMIDDYFNEILEGVFFWEEDGAWSGSGDFTATLALEDPTYDCGAFMSLTDLDGNAIDGTVSLDGNGNVTITIKESYLKTLEPGVLVCCAEFENALMMYGVNIPEKSANTNTGTSASAASAKTSSPKTGVKGVSLAAALLAVSGTAAFVSRKKKK